MIDVQGQSSTRMGLDTAIFQLDAFVASIAAEAEVQRTRAGVQADVERYVAGAAFHVRSIIADATKTADPMRHVIITLHSLMNSANSAIMWAVGGDDVFRDADARIFVYVAVIRKARFLAGLCGMLGGS